MEESLKSLSLQEKYAPKNACFGCGPQNPKGLHIRSFPQNGEVLATFQPKKEHEAFPGVLNGGIIGTILDCHSNWTAAWFLMQANHETIPPCTVTAEYSIKLLRPTPSDQVLTLRAVVVNSTESSAEVEATLRAGDKVCATCKGRFVAVKPGHPGYYRW